MICRKKIQKTGKRCTDKAIARTDIDTPLCAHHYELWLNKLNIKGHAYYKGLARRKSEILHFIYFDCITRKMDIEKTIEVMMRHTFLGKEDILYFLTRWFDEGQKEFLLKYPNWKTMLKKPKKL